MSDGSLIRARTVVVATGVEYRRLDIPRLAHFEGAGVYYAAGEMESRLCGGSEVIVSVAATRRDRRRCSWRGPRGACTW